MEKLARLFEDYTGGSSPQVQLLKGEGSNRKYYRLSAGDFSCVGVVGESGKENHSFVSLSRHFESKGIPVPKILCVSADEMRYLQTDLGDTSLFQLVSQGIRSGLFSADEKAVLKDAIRVLPMLQIEGAKGLDFSVCYPLEAFDRRSVMWDLNYFKYCFLKQSGVDFFEPSLEDDFERFADMLLAVPMVAFHHRDFQSRNVMIADGKPYVIDFQGGRKGPCAYDVASFVWQAKANFPDDLREELVSCYMDELEKFMDFDRAEFRRQLDLYVLFRTLQVLGAYGFRGLYERKPHFLESIPFAIKNLKDILKKGDYGVPYLCDVLGRMCSLPKFEKSADGLDRSKLTVRVFSFSYKKGIPEDESGNGGGYVFDCRAVHNPGRYDEYKALTGLQKPVIDFLERDGEILSFLDEVYSLADAHVERYIERGFTNLMFSFGCTGGQHRSVYSAQHLAEHIAKKFGVRVELEHREQNIRQTL
jgi:aminoglycoside/choline kinase family phosphotransferase